MMTPHPNAASVARAPRDRTQPCPLGPMRLTDRDRKLLVDIYCHRMMLRRQIVALEYFTSTGRANARLRTLFDHALLRRYTLPVLNGRGDAIYAAGPGAISLLAEELDLLPGEVRRNLCDAAGPRLIEHTIAVVDLRCIFLNACRARGLAMEWRSEYEARHAYEVKTIGQTEFQPHVFRPDGYLCVEINGAGQEPSAFFIEADRANTSFKRWAEKFHSYKQYEASGLFAKRYHQSAFGILIVTTVEAIGERLRAQAETMGHRNVWITTFTELEQEGPLALIWCCPFQKDRTIFGRT